MSFLLDTNVISEITRPNPDPRVVSFLHETDEDRLFVSVITLGELRRGVALKADGRATAILKVPRGLVLTALIRFLADEGGEAGW